MLGGSGGTSVTVGTRANLQQAGLDQLLKEVKFRSIDLEAMRRKRSANCYGTVKIYYQELARSIRPGTKCFVSPPRHPPTRLARSKLPSDGMGKRPPGSKKAESQTERGLRSDLPLTAGPVPTHPPRV